MTRRLLLATLLVVVTLSAYSNSLSSPFLFDDQDVIVDNETIRSLSPLSRALRGPDESSTAGRPLLNLSFAISYALGGLNPVAYHAGNLLLHTLNGLLLFGIVRRAWTRAWPARAEATQPPVVKRSRSKRGTSAAVAGLATPLRDYADATLAGFLCALLWLLHPLATEVIDYATQRSEALWALAALATLYAFVRSLDSTRAAAWQCVAVVACALGMFCKESMVTVPLLVLLFDCAVVSSTPMAAVRARSAMYGGLFAAWLILIPLNISGPRSNSAGFSTDVDAWTYLLNQGPLLLRYFRLALVPYGLVLDYGLPRAIGLGEAALPCLTVAALAIGSVAAWHWNRAIGFLATVVFVTLAPTSSIVPIATEVGAERRIYLGLAAIVVLLVVAARRLLTDRRAWIGAVSALAITFGGLTFLRNADYHDPLALWQQVVDRYPHGRAHYNLALALEAAGRRSEGAAEMQRAAAVDFAEAEYALGFELAKQQRYGEAITRLRRYVAMRPADLNVLRAYNLIGQSALAMNQPAEAAAAFEETLKRNPGNVDALGGRGDALVRLQRWDDAIDTYQTFLAHRTDGAAYFNFGLALMARQRHTEAIAAFERAAQINPRDPAPHAQLATLFGNAGNTTRAVQEFERVLALDPDPQAQAEVRQMIASLSR